jgi:hypothetical protein
VRQFPNSVLGRALVAISGLLLFGLVLRLLLAILGPVLPPSLMAALTAGWGTLLGLMGPALPPIMAALILGAICWAFFGRR